MSVNPKLEILNRIKKGLDNAQIKTGFTDRYTTEEIYITPNKPLVEIFEDELTKISGKYFYCNDEQDAAEKINALNKEKELEPVFCSDTTLFNLLELAGINYISDFDDNIKTGFSVCEKLIARFGSIMVSSAIPGARKVFSYPHTHIVIARENQLVMELEEGLNAIAEKYKGNLPSQIINITGPSRTADIEKTLILGAHGPKELIVFVIKS
jgi:L-lactate dehydrogenase complex protein LldG